MAIDVIGRQVEALMIESFRLIDQRLILLHHAQLVISRSQVVVAVGIRRIGLLCDLKLLQSFRVPPLLIQAHAHGVLAGAGKAAAVDVAKAMIASNAHVRTVSIFPHPENR